MHNYVVATIKQWHLDCFRKIDSPEWFLVTDPKELTLERLKTINPRYVFFPHWSWIVPDEIINTYECVCFHSSDVPYGRGGSPIQNLIIRGLTQTKVSALRMVKELDAGPVYMKRDLSLLGRAQDIFERSAGIIMEMMQEIANTEPTPEPQIGEATLFKRRQGEDNILPQEGGLEHLYNHIRMLDAESYPPSYLFYGRYCLEFSHAEYDGKEIAAKVKIREVE